jgi:hypothetical protein
LAVRKLAETSPEAEPQLKVLREFIQDIVAVRRADHSAARLKLEQERQAGGRHKRAGDLLQPSPRLGSARASRAAVDASSTAPCAPPRQVNGAGRGEVF